MYRGWGMQGVAAGMHRYGRVQTQGCKLADECFMQVGGQPNDARGPSPRTFAAASPDNFLLHAPQNNAQRAACTDPPPPRLVWAAGTYNLPPPRLCVPRTLNASSKSHSTSMGWHSRTSLKPLVFTHAGTRALFTNSRYTCRSARTAARGN